MDLTYFNPNSQKETDFLLGFVARQRTLDFFIRQLHNIPANGAARHHLIVAPRGFGKTSLLRRIAIDVRREELLNTRFIALRFREEQHNVISLDAFWRNCLQSLAEAREDEGASPDELDTLDIAWETHAPRQALKQEEQDGEPAWQVLREHCERLDRRPLLLIDNLDTLLAGLSAQHQWSLRKHLQSDDGPILIAAASRYPASTHDQTAAFYEFFRIHPLEKLSDDEVFACLRNIAVHRNQLGQPVLALLEKDPGRVVALNTMAGGNPRTLSVLYGVLESHMNEDVLSQLNAMLDTFTGWYQARTEELPMQSRAVFDALALNWDPMTAAALGIATGLDTSAVSSQLTRLEKAAYVEPVTLQKRGKGRNGYQVSERFFNIWYLMRNGRRRARQNIFFLTKFLQSCFSSAERRSHALSILKNGQSDPGYTLALAGSFRAGRLRQQLLEQAQTRSNDNGEEGEYEALINELRNEGQRKSNSTARQPEKIKALISGYDAIITRFGAATEPDLRERVSKALINKGIRLGALGESEKAIAVYDEIIDRFGKDIEIGVRTRVASALINKAFRLGKLGKTDQEIMIYDNVITRFGTDTNFSLRKRVAKALFNKGFSLSILGQHEQSVVSYDELILRFSMANEPELKDYVAMAFINKGMRLAALGQSEQAIIAYDNVIARFGNTTESELRERVGMALVRKGFRLAVLGQHELAIASYDDVIARFSNTTDTNLHEQVAKALFNKGFSLGTLNRSDEAIAAYEDIINRFGERTELTLRTQVAKAFINKGARFGILGQQNQEIEAYDDVINRFGTATEPVLRDLVAKALVGKGSRLSLLGQAEQEIAAYNDIVVRFGDATETGLREHVAAALVNKGLRLGALGQFKKEIETYDNVITRFGTATEPGLRERVAMALFNKACRFGIHNQSELEVEVYDDIINRFGKDTESGLSVIVAKTLFNKAIRLGELSQLTQEIAVYDDIITRFDTAPELGLRERVAAALVNKGYKLGVLGQTKQEIAAYDEVIDHFSTYPELTLQEQVAIALVNKGLTLGDLGQLDQAIAIYDEVVKRFGEASNSALREQVIMALGEKALLLCLLERFEDSKSTYQDAIEWDSSIARFHLGLSQLFLDFTGEISGALDALQIGLEAIKGQKDRVLLHANMAYAIVFHGGDKLTAQEHAKKALEDQTVISLAGRNLLEALPIWSKNSDQDWMQVFEKIGEALNSKDPELWNTYSDDMQRILWILITRGQGTQFKQWMLNMGLQDQYAPLYHAFIAALDGEDHLLRVNPETRQPAEVIYNGLARKLRLLQKKS